MSASGEVLGSLDRSSRAARLIRDAGVVAAVLVVLDAIHAVLLRNGIRTGTPPTFHVSVFEGPRFEPRGLPFLVAFVAVAAFATARVDVARLRRRTILAATQAAATQAVGSYFR